MVPASTSLHPQFVRSPSAPVTHRKIGSVRWAHASPVQAVRSWFPSFTSPSSSPEGTEPHHPTCYEGQEASSPCHPWSLRCFYETGAGARMSFLFIEWGGTGAGGNSGTEWDGNGSHEWQSFILISAEGRGLEWRMNGWNGRGLPVPPLLTQLLESIMERSVLGNSLFHSRLVTVWSLPFHSRSPLCSGNLARRDDRRFPSPRDQTVARWGWVNRARALQEDSLIPHGPFLRIRDRAVREREVPKAWPFGSTSLPARSPRGVCDNRRFDWGKWCRSFVTPFHFPLWRWSEVGKERVKNPEGPYPSSVRREKEISYIFSVPTPLTLRSAQGMCNPSSPLRSAHRESLEGTGCSVKKIKT